MKQEAIERIRKEISEYKFRSSKAGTVVSKSGKVGKEQETYAIECLWKLISPHTDEEIGTDAIIKGHLCEGENRRLIGRLLFPGEYIKEGQRRVSSPYFIGHLDYEHRDIIIDAKNSENFRTYMKAELTYDYERQMQTYMLGASLEDGRDKKGFIAYTLMDTPEQLIEGKVSKEFALLRKRYGDDAGIDVEEVRRKVIQRETYPLLEDVDRVKLFPVVLSQKDIQDINETGRNLRAEMQNLFECIVVGSENIRDAVARYGL